jgi:hypothetical protein
MDDDEMYGDDEVDCMLQRKRRFGTRFGITRRSTLRRERYARISERDSCLKMRVLDVSSKLEQRLPESKTLLTAHTGASDGYCKNTVTVTDGNDELVLKLKEEDAGFMGSYWLGGAYSVNKQYRWLAIERIKELITDRRDHDPNGLTVALLEHHRDRYVRLTVGVPGQLSRTTTVFHPGRRTIFDIGAHVRDLVTVGKSKWDRSLRSTFDAGKPRHKTSRKFVAQPRKVLGSFCGCYGDWRGGEEPTPIIDRPVLYVDVETPLPETAFPRHRSAQANFSYYRFRSEKRYRKGRKKEAYKDFQAAIDGKL